MITLDISPKQVGLAKDLYPFHSLRGSITKGSSEIYGALGEVIVVDYFKTKGYKVEYKSTYDYDMIINGKTVDVKTKRTTVVPQPDYFCSVVHTDQSCGYYFFVRIMDDLTKGYILGYKKRTDFLSEALFRRAGEVDENGFVFKCDCYNIPINKLNEFK